MSAQKKFLTTKPILIAFLIGSIALSMNCSSAIPEKPLGEKGVSVNENPEALADRWLKLEEYSQREEILQELERQRAFDELIFCFDIAGWLRSGPEERNRDREYILYIFGNLKEPKTIPLIVGQLTSLDSSLRIQALDALGKIKDPETVDDIFPLLYDQDPQLRGKAIHTLGEIGDSRAIAPISHHLADSDFYVRKLAEDALRKLGTAEDEISAWKKKAEGMTLDDL
jgi:HEAT repeat protein